MMLDYVTLKIIWFVLFAVIVVAFLVTAGMDVGVNFLLPIVAKSDYDRRLVINAIGPTWEGNQVWLVLFIAGLFAIWPTLYATLLYSMYFLCLFLVFTLILRPPGIDYRNKIYSQRWRKTWDVCLFVASVMIVFSIAVVISKMFTGLPYYFDADMRPVYTGSVYKWFNPTTILCFAVTLAVLTVQGGLFLQYKLQDIPARRAKHAIQIAGWIFLATFVAAGMYICYWVPAYKITSIPDPNTAFVITSKVVVAQITGWNTNYVANKWLCLLPILAFIGTRSAMRASKFDRPVLGLTLNSIGIVCLVASAGIALFPFLLTSNINPNHSLTVWDAAASYKTLLYSLVAVAILLPIVLLYTVWVYRVMRGKVVIKSDSY